MSNKHLTDAMLVQKCFLIRDGKILALRRPVTDHSRGGCWDTPGGGYEAGEDVLASIAREVREEVGLVIHHPHPLYFANKIGATDGLYYGDHVFAICYFCDNWEGEIKLSPEHTEYRWVTPDEFLTYDFGDDGGFFSNSLTAYIKLSKDNC